MSIGRCGSIYIFGMCILDSFQKPKVQIRLSLKIHDQIHQMSIEFVNNFFECILIQHPCRSGKRPQATWAFRASEITRCGGLNGDTKW